VSGSRAVLDLHSLVCATNRIPETLHQCLDEFDLTGLVPYDTRYLADWPAETYGITLENASLIARRIALAKFRTKAQTDIEGVRELEMNFNRVGIDSFQLLTLPFWTGRVGQWKYGFESPFKADVYYVTTRLFTGNKWGTSNTVSVSIVTPGRAAGMAANYRTTEDRAREARRNSQ
jgi:hypothetical protein